MPKLFRDFVGFLISSIIFGWVIRKMPRSLVDNAVTSYIDNKIGAAAGLTEAAADGFLSEWLIPILLGVVAVVLWHRWASGQLQKEQSTPPKSAMLVWAEGLPGRARTWIARVEPSHVIILGLAIALGGVVWQMRKSSGSTDVRIEQQIGKGQETSGPIKWTPGYLIGARQTPNGIEIYSFQITGENISDEFIGKLSGFVRSDVTGKQFPLLVLDRNDWLPVEDFGIPAKHQFHLASHFVSSGGMPPPQFLQDFGRLTFQFEYDGKIYKRSFGAAEIEADVRRTEADLRPISRLSVAGVSRVNADKTPEVKPPSKPHYETEEIGAMLGVLRKWSEIIDKKCDPASLILQQMSHGWEAQIKNEGPASKIEALKNARNLADSSWDEIRKILNDNQYYLAELQPIISSNSDANATIDDALLRLIESLEEMAKYPGINAVKYLDPTFQRMQSVETLYQRWIGTTRAAILAKTKELREWKNQ